MLFSNTLFPKLQHKLKKLLQYIKMKIYINHDNELWIGTVFAI